MGPKQVNPRAFVCALEGDESYIQNTLAHESCSR